MKARWPAACTSRSSPAKGSTVPKSTNARGTLSFRRQQGHVAAGRVDKEGNVRTWAELVGSEASGGLNKGLSLLASR